MWRQLSTFLLLLCLTLFPTGCDGAARDGQEGRLITFRKKDDDSNRTGERISMVKNQIERRDVRDKRVLEAMRLVPRHLFVPEAHQAEAYRDYPLPIGHGQTISQPYIVALMSELLELEPDDKVLEIGTGSGYQAAVLGKLAGEVYTIEIVNPLAERSEKLMTELGYQNIHVRAGDGFFGWPDEAPFDGIVVTAAPEKVPPPLLEQLSEGGRLVIPEGKFSQDLVVYQKIDGKINRREVIPVRFVPMTGQAEK